MNLKPLLLLLAALPMARAAAQFSLVHPAPQSVTRPAAAPLLSDAPQRWAIKADASRRTSLAAKLLAQGATVDAKARFKVTMGVCGDKTVKRFADRIPDHGEGYYLKVTADGAVIAANDEQGLHYGARTLLASMAKGKVETGEVSDWPDVAFRGAVEGFYGTPWSHEARLSQLDFYGRHKMNTYIYGPKDDPYHRKLWRKPYPAADAQRIQELCQRAKDNGVAFYWAIHPGGDIKWDGGDPDSIVAKLETMYGLGVRSFAVFFDDIWGEGTKADRQVELLNHIDETFIRRHHDVSPLIMCPTVYNRAWVNDDNDYLRPLGDNLNKDIYIMWTGNKVVSCIDRESVEWVDQRIGRKAFIWWNFPVSDYVRDRILLGPAGGNGLDVASAVSGFVSNPMEHAEASKISLYGIAAYTWNMRSFDAEAEWRDAMAEVLPSNAAALRTFASYSKELGNNSQDFTREEGTELLPLVSAATAGNGDSVMALRRKCVELNRAADILLGDTANQRLRRELLPWLLQGKNVANYGCAVCDMAACTGDESFPDLHAQALSARRQMYDLEMSAVVHDQHPGAKVATAVLLPALDTLFAQATDAYNNKKAATLRRVAAYEPYKVTGDVAGISGQPVSVFKYDVSVKAPSAPVVWKPGGTVEIMSDRDITLSQLALDAGEPGIKDSLSLEAYCDGRWQPVTLRYKREGDTVIRAGFELDGMSGSRLRLTNTSSQTLTLNVKSLTVTRR